MKKSSSVRFITDLVKLGVADFLSGKDTQSMFVRYNLFRLGGGFINLVWYSLFL